MRPSRPPRPPAPLLLAALLLLISASASRVHPAPPAPPAIRRVSADVPRLPPQFNINSGGPAVARFVPDIPQWLVGPTAVSDQPALAIGGAEPRNRPMYRSHRYGLAAAVWGYDLPLMDPGLYDCTVHFAETHPDAFAVGARVFDLVIATSAPDSAPVVFADIDIFAELDGAQFTVLTKTVTDLVIPGLLAIRVVPKVADAIISGVTCERTADLPAGVRPDFETDPNIPVAAMVAPTTGTVPDAGAVIIGTEININAGGPALGRFLAEDFAWIFGNTSQWGGPDGVQIGGAEPKNAPALISHRYGTHPVAPWGYNIPVQLPGIYDCSLHFAETDTASFAKGARVFNVQIMDQSLDRIDIFADANTARFTSVVKTFVDLRIGNQLDITLTPVKGNAFLSAITCEKTADLDPNDPLLPVVSPIAEVSEMPENGEATPIVEVPNVEVPIVEGPTSVESSIAATPAAAVQVAESPTAESSLVETPTPAAAVDGGLEEVVPSPMPSLPVTTVTVTPAPSLDILASSPEVTPVQELSGTDEGNAPIIPMDDPLTPKDGQQIQDYKLLGKISNGGIFTTEMKDALLRVSQQSANNPSVFVMVDLNEESIAPVSRQESNDRNYQIDLQAQYDEETIGDEKRDYTTFIQDGDADAALKESGINDLAVELREEPEFAPGSTKGDEASTTQTSTVVGIVVGAVLGLLVVVAVVAFVGARRNRNNDHSAHAFDGPPPAMTESDMSSVMERSETAASIEYLDDDSTFTAATSRAGDHVDQVAFDKDIFGRGTATGSHGVS